MQTSNAFDIYYVLDPKSKILFEGATGLRSAANNYGEVEWKFKSYFANIGTYIANRKALIGATNNSVNTLYRQYQV